MGRTLIFIILCGCLLQACVNHDTITSHDQFKLDTASLNSYVPNQNSNAIKTPAGFWYSIDVLGNGLFPTQSDEVTIRYKVKLIPNQTDKPESELDTIGHSKLTTVLLSRAISGLQQSLMLFPANSSGRIYLPSGLAFGPSGHQDHATDTSHLAVPPNANLLYEIELLSVKSAKFASDTTAIGSYLQTNSVSPVPLRDSSGIRYTIDHIDTSYHSDLFADPLDFVKVTYNERVMSTDSLVSLVSTPTTVALADQVTCWRIMLTKKYFKAGYTFTMYSPSGYAYGSSTVSASGKTIPINSNMIYTVTLLEVIPHK